MIHRSSQSRSWNNRTKNSLLINLAHSKIIRELTSIFESFVFNSCPADLEMFEFIWKHTKAEISPESKYRLCWQMTGSYMSSQQLSLFIMNRLFDAVVADYLLLLFFRNKTSCCYVCSKKGTFLVYKIAVLFTECHSWAVCACDADRSMRWKRS